MRMNQVVMVGKIVEIGDDNITIFISREVTDDSKEQISDLVTITLSEKIYNLTKLYCSIDDLIAIKGYATTKDDKTQIVAERVSFLSTQNREEE